jgi:hypothetical protein
MSNKQSKNYKVCLVIPAGRERYLRVLIPQLLKQEGWDSLKLWVNTKDSNDLQYIQTLPSLDSRICLESAPKFEPDGFKTIGQFFANCVSPDTVYIRFDDDICFVEKDLVQNLARFRWENKEPFLISPIIINNALCACILQVLGKIRYPYVIYANCWDRIGWRDPVFAERFHQYFLQKSREGKIDHFKFQNRPIAISRYSINCISWLGEEFAKFDGAVPFGDEEQFLSVTKPTQLGKINMFWGEKIAAHFSFYSQREHLDSTTILEEYRKFSDDYYQMNGGG